MPLLIIFDLDGTLAESKSPLDAQMAGLLSELLALRKVAVISGASFGQFQRQFLAHLMSATSHELENLSILPTNGSCFYKYEISEGRGQWKVLYQQVLTAEEKEHVKTSFDVVLGHADIVPFFKGRTIYGPQLEDRGSQVTFSGVGQQAPNDAKQDWDPDHKKRELIVAHLQPMLPDFQINIGGMTSIDVTKKGIDKEHGINALIEHFSIPKNAIMYVGDAIFPGGNDYAAVRAGVPTFPVTSVSETKNFIRDLIQGMKTPISGASHVGREEQSILS